MLKSIMHNLKIQGSGTDSQALCSDQQEATGEVRLILSSILINRVVEEEAWRILATNPR